jgi:hypothetical protein
MVCHLPNIDSTCIVAACKERLPQTAEPELFPPSPGGLGA